MPLTITDLTVHDIRFPTSKHLDGSDAMNPDPDYSAAYCVLHTSDGSTLTPSPSPNSSLGAGRGGPEGHGMTFTIGRGNDLCCRGIEALRPLIVGQTLEAITADMGKFWRHITGDSQLRWVGPEKGVIHLSTAAVVNAVWDLWAKVAGKPLWRLLADMTPEELVRCIDFRYITDALTPDDALAILRKWQPTKAERIAQLERDGYPAYTTSAGWLGYSDDKLRDLCRRGMAEGWGCFKIKVGRDLQDDIRRCRIIREEIGWDRRMMVDANQVWDVPQAIEWMRHLAPFKPWFIEEPTSPDDVLGHAAIAKAVAPIKVATGEHCANRVMFKQFLQAGAIGICQIDSCRIGGVNEILAVILMAAKFGVPVCPHAGGVGLCEYVQHLSMFDFVSVSGSMEDRLTEHAGHLHEHFKAPIQMRNGRYMPPTAPGYSIEMWPESIERYSYPTGAEWA